MNESKLFAALPDGWDGLFHHGLIHLRTVSGDDPDGFGVKSVAWTTYDADRRGFVVCVRADFVAAADGPALTAVLRHEVGHVVLGHFRTECRRSCDTLAKEAEVNWHLGEEALRAVEAAMSVWAGETVQVIWPRDVARTAGLSEDLPPLYDYLHPLLHQDGEDDEENEAGGDASGGDGGDGGDGSGQTSGDEQEQDGGAGGSNGGDGPEDGERGGPGRDDRNEDGEDGPGGDRQGGDTAASWCGGVLVPADAATAAAAAAAAAAIGSMGAVADDLGTQQGWGLGSAKARLGEPLPVRPPWVEEVLGWLDATLAHVFRLRATARRPRLDILRAARLVVPDSGYELEREEVRFAFVVDTSGSMVADLRYVELAVRFLLARGGTVRFVAGDTEVLVDEELTAAEPWREELLLGGGGTDIRPVFDRAVAYGPEAVVVFTDGVFPREWWPKPPEGMAVLWVVPEDALPPVGDVLTWKATWARRAAWS